jgi:peptidoglycan hydrolase-like protein with peptidoglycan-binding domain
LAAWEGKTEVVDLLLTSGASLSVMGNEVIKPSVKLRHSNIKLFKYRVILLLKQDPKTINIKQYLNTNNFSVNNRHFVIKSSQAAQLYNTKVFYK